jgi:hypothetical protein
VATPGSSTLHRQRHRWMHTAGGGTVRDCPDLPSLSPLRGVDVINARARVLVGIEFKRYTRST